MSYDQLKVWDNYFENNPKDILERSITGKVLKGFDCRGTQIARQSYGQEGSEYGWDVDHINRRRSGGGNNLANLRPMHIQNNRSRN